MEWKQRVLSSLAQRSTKDNLAFPLGLRPTLPTWHPLSPLPGPSTACVPPSFPTLSPSPGYACGVACEESPSVAPTSPSAAPRPPWVSQGTTFLMCSQLRHAGCCLQPNVIHQQIATFGSHGSDLCLEARPLSERLRQRRKTGHSLCLSAMYLRAYRKS